MAGDDRGTREFAERKRLLGWLEKEAGGTIDKIVDGLTKCLRSGGAVFACGNGGSASQAEHFAAELTGRFKMDRKPLRAYAVSTNSSTLTAVSNDYGFSEVFSRQIEGAAAEGDCLVAITTSGSSQNVVNACRKARGMSVKVFTFTGGSGGPVVDDSDVVLRVPDDDTARIQEIHLTALHLICQMVEEEMFSTKPTRSQKA